MVSISDAFDGGNIEVVSAADPGDIQLRIRPDVGGEHFQWFYFRVAGARGRSLRLRIVNARDASYEQGWPGYRACVSSDLKQWKRVPTRYESGELLIDLKAEKDVVYVSYFAPYDEAQHRQLIAWALDQEDVRHEELGQTLDGRSLDLLRVGSPKGMIPIWIIARQHPGETMAEYFVEGLLQRLLDPADALARWLRRLGVFYIVPNMNPDGSARGHLRTNAAGANLNREWGEPTMERSPEVALVRQKMDETGLRFCLDVHGDEALPYNFIAGADGAVGITPELLGLRDRFAEAYERANPDFQREFGYPVAAPGEGNMTMATNALAARFSALTMTLEMPFKDNAKAPHFEMGWSPERARRLGASALDALAEVMASLPE